MQLKAVPLPATWIVQRQGGLDSTC